MSNEVAIKVDGVSKNFKLPHQKVNSIKSVFTNISKKRNKSFEVQHALKNITLEIKKGEFFGIVGRNGSGKSTLLKILAEIYQPTEGTVRVSGRLVPFIELGVGFNPELTGRENVYLNGALLGFSSNEIDQIYDEIVEFAELEKFMDQKLKNYSSGMQVRLAFSVATHAKADILLIDEVLAVGDADFQRKCFQYFRSLKRDKTTVVFVSHDMASVREFCDKAALIDKNEIVDINDADLIAHKYSELFIDATAQNDSRPNDSEERWGSGEATTEEVKIRNVQDDIVISSKVHAHTDIDTITYGMHVIASDGKEVTAMNNIMLEKPSIKNVRKDDKYEITWKVMNIFNDGEYTVDLTLVDASGKVLDWHTSAGDFRVKRLQRSTTSVFPPLEVMVNLVE